MELFEKSRKQTLVDYEKGIFNFEVVMEGQTQNWADYECMMKETPFLYKDTCEDCLACGDMEAADSDFPLYGGAVQMEDGSVLYIKKVIYSNPAVVINWSDDTTTKAICMKGDTYNAEFGLMLAVMKKLMGQDFATLLLSDWAPTGMGNETLTIKDIRKKYKTINKLMKQSSSILDTKNEEVKEEEAE